MLEISVGSFTFLGDLFSGFYASNDGYNHTQLEIHVKLNLITTEKWNNLQIHIHKIKSQCLYIIGHAISFPMQSIYTSISIVHNTCKSTSK